MLSWPTPHHASSSSAARGRTPSPHTCRTIYLSAMARSLRDSRGGGGGLVCVGLDAADGDGGQRAARRADAARTTQYGWAGGHGRGGTAVGGGGAGRWSSPLLAPTLAHSFWRCTVSSATAELRNCNRLLRTQQAEAHVSNLGCATLFFIPPPQVSTRVADGPLHAGL